MLPERADAAPVKAGELGTTLDALGAEVAVGAGAIGVPVPVGYGTTTELMVVGAGLSEVSGAGQALTVMVTTPGAEW